MTTKTEIKKIPTNGIIVIENGVRTLIMPELKKQGIKSRMHTAMTTRDREDMLVLSGDKSEKVLRYLLINIYLYADIRKIAIENLKAKTSK